MFDSTTKLLTLLILTSDQDRISPNTISTISSGQVKWEQKKSIWGHWLIQFQILQTDITWIIWQTYSKENYQKKSWELKG